MIQYHIERKSIKPVYIQLKETLRTAIEDGRLKPLSAMPHVDVIAEEAGVSLRTADNALRELIKEGLCFRRPKKGTYVRGENIVKKQRVCGILGHIDPTSYPLQTLLYCGVMESSARNGIMPILIPVSKTKQKEEEAPEEVIRRFDRGSEFDIQGLIITENSFLFEDVMRLSEMFPEKRFFYLCYNNDFSGKMRDNVTAIINDDFSGAYCLAQYAFSEFRSGTASIFSMRLHDGDLSYRERVRGFKTAARDMSVKISKVIEIEQCSIMNDQIEHSYSCVKKMLSNGTVPDIIFCVNDLFAYGTRKAIREAGQDGNVRVTGYDCIHNLPDFSVPTVKVNYMEMGRLAVEKMVSPETRMNTVIKIMPEIIRAKH